MHNYLIVYGYNVMHSKSCYKETEINDNELEKYKPIIKEIENNDSGENWTGGIILDNKNDRYVEHNLLYEKYPQFSKNLLDDFSKYLPSGITNIRSIKIFKGEKITII